MNFSFQSSMSHTALQAQVSSFNIAELNRQLLEAPGLDETLFVSPTKPEGSTCNLPYVMESLLSEQNIYNTQSQHFSVKLKSKQYSWHKGRPDCCNSSVVRVILHTCVIKE